MVNFVKGFTEVKKYYWYLGLLTVRTLWPLPYIGLTHFAQHVIFICIENTDFFIIANISPEIHLLFFHSFHLKRRRRELCVQAEVIEVREKYKQNKAANFVAYVSRT